MTPMRQRSMGQLAATWLLPTPGRSRPARPVPGTGPTWPSSSRSSSPGLVVVDGILLDPPVVRFGRSLISGAQRAGADRPSGACSWRPSSTCWGLRSSSAWWWSAGGPGSRSSAGECRGLGPDRPGRPRRGSRVRADLGDRRPRPRCSFPAPRTVRSPRCRGSTGISSAWRSRPSRWWRRSSRRPSSAASCMAGCATTSTCRRQRSSPAASSPWCTPSP